MNSVARSPEASLPGPNRWHGLLLMGRVRAWGVVLALCFGMGGQGLELAWAAGGYGRPPDRTLRSSSGQFVVAAPQGLGPLGPAVRDTNAPVLLELEAASLLMTCERVKKALLWELRSAGDRWSGPIYVVVNPGLTNGQTPVIGAQRFLQGWAYRLELPRKVAPVALLRSLVQVLVLEMANRNAGTRSAEVPLWLSEGLTLHLARSSLVDLAVEAPREVVNAVRVRTDIKETRRPDPLAIPRERLRGHGALTVLRMGEVRPDELREDSWLTFQACSHLFVHNLLALQGGRVGVRQTIAQLPNYLNWQGAFLAGFNPGFTRMLEVEKWWSVVLVHFTGLDPFNAWSPRAAADRMEDALRPPVLLPIPNTQENRRARVTLQEVLRGWDYLRQRPLLQSAATQLSVMRVKLPPELAVLADEYRQVLTEFLDARARLGRTRPVPLAPSEATRQLVEGAVRRLDELDGKRQALAMRMGPAEATAPGPGRVR